MINEQGDLQHDTVYLLILEDMVIAQNLYYPVCLSFIFLCVPVLQVVPVQSPIALVTALAIVGSLVLLTILLTGGAYLIWRYVECGLQ